MVTVTGYRIVETEVGEKYVRLVLTGESEMVLSESSGNYYATTKRATISSTFDEDIAKKMIGKELPGITERIPVEPYEYMTDTGEVNKLSHPMVYRQENVVMPAEKEPKESSIGGAGRHS